MDNKLSLALDKTELMLFSPKSNIKEGEDIKIANLKRVAEFKYLGVYIDSKLNFSKHLKKSCQENITKDICTMKTSQITPSNSHKKTCRGSHQSLFILLL